MEEKTNRELFMDGVIALFKSGNATEEQWREMAVAVTIIADTEGRRWRVKEIVKGIEYKED